AGSDGDRWMLYATGWFDSATAGLLHRTGGAWSPVTLPDGANNDPRGLALDATGAPVLAFGGEEGGLTLVTLVGEPSRSRDAAGNVVIGPDGEVWGTNSRGVVSTGGWKADVFRDPAIWADVDGVHALSLASSDAVEEIVFDAACGETVTEWAS